MKIKNLTPTLLGMVLICAGMASCGKDEPKPSLGNVIPDAHAPIHANRTTKIFIDNFLSENNNPFELTNGTLFRFMVTPIVEYKLYNLKNGKLTDSGLTKKISTLNVINMFAGKLIFNNKNQLMISNCINTFPGNTTQTLYLDYTYNDGYIKISSNQATELTNIILNPISTTKGSLKESAPWHSASIETEEDYNHYIIAEESPEVMTFLNNISNFIIRYGKNKLLIVPWTQDNQTYCTIYPDDNVCRTFCLNVVIPFLYSMSEYADKDYLICDGISYFIRDITKENIEYLRKNIETSPSSGTFAYTTGYQFLK